MTGSATAQARGNRLTGEPATDCTSPNDREPLKAGDAALSDHGGILHETVTACVRQYLDEIDGEPTTDFYQLVLSQVEPPLLREIMTYTRHNQTRAAQILGLNRGTLRKKLRQYDISLDSQ